MVKLKELVKHVSPAIASAIGGPFSGVAIKYLSDKLIGENSDDDGDLEKKLMALLKEPENLHKLKGLDKEFELEMKKLDIDIFQLEIKDRNSARAFLKRDFSPQIMISILFLTAYFIMLAAIFAVEASDTINIHKGKNSLMGELQILFGVLTAGVGQILSFWFGGVLKKSDSSH